MSEAADSEIAEIREMYSGYIAKSQDHSAIQTLLRALDAKDAELTEARKADAVIAAAQALSDTCAFPGDLNEALAHNNLDAALTDYNGTKETDK